MTRFATITMLLLCLVATPASAAPVPGSQLAISLSLQSQVWHGAAQSYHVKIEPTSEPVGSVYVLWFIHSDTQIIGTNHTDGLDCHTFEQTPVMITCSTGLLTDTQMVSIHGTVTGPGDGGHYPSSQYSSQCKRRQPQYNGGQPHCHRCLRQ
jgi:hypothetical protein